MTRLPSFAALGALLVASASSGAAEAPRLELPYAAVGLDEREAAAYLADRLTFGTRPGDIDRMLEVGLERWLGQQLQGALPEPELETRLEGLEALHMSHDELSARYPSSSQMSAHLRRFHPGVIPPRDVPILDFSVVSAKIDAFREEHGFLTQEEDLRGQLVAQKLLRAVYAENQLREVLADFWQNHFFTSPASFNARLWILPHEQEALRPNALGEFRTLLGAVAKHPALRRYHAGSERSGEVGRDDSTMGRALERLRASGMSDMQVEALEARAESEIVALEYEEDLILSREFWNAAGPNLEYARALVALQTLGPDGPHDAQDIEAVARAFTGWSTVSYGASEAWFERGFEDALELGFIREGSFLFRADQHDAREKKLLGRDLPAGGGIEEGEYVLDYLARHPSTARHIAHKLAVRFVSDAPPEPLVARLARTFQTHGGDIAAVMATLVESPEFWREATARSKIKTPLEYAASALRAMGAELEATTALAGWIARMGQPLYYYLEPTGFPDSGGYWLDSASLIERLNFARSLAANEIDGVAVDRALVGTGPHGPSTAAALAERMLPGRNLSATVAALRSAAAEHEALAALVIASPEFQLR